MLRILTILLALLQLPARANCNGFYTITAPGTIRTDSNYTIVVSLHQSAGPATINVGLKGPQLSKSKTIEIQPYSTKKITFNLPDLPDGAYHLFAEGSNGVIFNNSTELLFNPKRFQVNVLTDRSTYEPEEVIQIKVLILNHNNRLLKRNQLLNILIKDKKGNIVRYYPDIYMVNGTYTRNHKLSDYAALGKWSIIVREGNIVLKEKEILIKDNKPPKFYLKFESPTDMLFNDKIVPSVIRATYPDGTPVKGNLTVVMKTGFKRSNGEILLEQSNKTITMEGMGQVNLSITDQIGYAKPNNDLSYLPIQITAALVDEKTDFKESISTTVKAHHSKYYIRSSNVPYEFTPGKPISFDIIVKTFDGKPATGSVKLFASYPREIQYKDKPADYSLTQSLIDGSTVFNFTFENIHYYGVTASFQGIDRQIRTIYRKEEAVKSSHLNIEVLTSNPSLSKEMSVKVAYDKPFDYFIYHIVARGNIVKAGRVDLPESSTLHTFQFTPTFDMVPKARILVLTILDGNFAYGETNCDFPVDLENNVSIESEAEGDNVNLKVKTAPNSIVAILAGDMVSWDKEFSKASLFKELKEYETMAPWQRGYGEYPGEDAGLVMLTNGNFEYSMDIIKSKILPKLQPAIHREDIKDDLEGLGYIELPYKNRDEQEKIWFWEDFNTTRGEFLIQKKLPNSLVSWKLLALSMSFDKGLGLTNMPVKIDAPQPFSAYISLPYSMKVGEELLIPVYVFNHLDHEMNAKVDIENLSQGGIKDIAVPPKGVRSANFLFTPTKAEDILLKIQVLTVEGKKKITGVLRVRPEGVTIFTRTSILLSLQDKFDQSETLNVNIPDQFIPQSESVEILGFADLMGMTIGTTFKLERQVFGCGEWNMADFNHNLLMMRYLSAVKKLGKFIEEITRTNLEDAYQRQLSYKHSDGSFSNFGEKDQKGSTWLTANVAKSFYQAQKFTFIDPKLIDQSLEYLASMQMDSGEFRELGPNHFPESEDSGLILSSYVVLSFLENKKLPTRYHKTINKGLEFIAGRAKITHEAYPMAIASYALIQGRNNKVGKILPRLDFLASKDFGMKWWTDQAKSTSHSYDLEATSYALLAFLEIQPTDELFPIVNWLIWNIDDNSRDMNLPLQALSKFSRKVKYPTSNLMVDFKNNEGLRGLLGYGQAYELPKSTRKVMVNASGEGFSIVQIAYKYNTVDEDKSIFKTKVAIEKMQGPLRKLKVCTTFDGYRSNIAMMELNLPSGYFALKDEFETMSGLIKKMETRDDDTLVLVYYEGLERAETCFEMSVIKMFDVTNLKPGSIRVNDCWDPSRMSREFFKNLSD